MISSDSFSNEDIDDIIASNLSSENQDSTLADNSHQEESSSSSASNDSQENSSPTVPDTSLLSANSPSLLVDESTSRFSGAEWFSEIQKARVIIAGIGGIGSNVAFQIARMAPASITLYDDDDVELANMSGQLFNLDSIGKSKVSAAYKVISSFTSSIMVTALKRKFTSSSEPSDIMICGFDNMDARKVFFFSWLEYVKSKPSEEDRAKCLFIDGRLSMDTLQIFCIQGNDDYNIKRYKEEFLFSDSDAEPTVCSRKQTTYLACMIGSLITNLFVNFIANSLSPAVPYDLPFFTEYDSQTMLFKTEC